MAHSLIEKMMETISVKPLTSKKTTFTVSIVMSNKNIRTSFFLDWNQILYFSQTTKSTTSRYSIFLIKGHCSVLMVSCLKHASTDLTNWGRVTSELTIIGSDNGLWTGRYQTLIWIIAGIMLIGALEANWNINRNSYISIQENLSENVVWKMASVLSPAQCVN